MKGLINKENADTNQAAVVANTSKEKCMSKALTHENDL
jgi:hypothetical protein